MGQSAMTRASNLASARAMALSAPPLAWFCAAAWLVFTPPLTADETAQQAKMISMTSGTGSQIRTDLSELIT